MSESSNLQPETLAVHAGQEEADSRVEAARVGRAQRASSKRLLGVLVPKVEYLPEQQVAVEE